jgi:hypothetical protein
MYEGSRPAAVQPGVAGVHKQELHLLAAKNTRLDPAVEQKLRLPPHVLPAVYVALCCCICNSSVQLYV